MINSQVRTAKRNIVKNRENLSTGTLRAGNIGTSVLWRLRVILTPWCMSLIYFAATAFSVVATTGDPGASFVAVGA